MPRATRTATPCHRSRQRGRPSAASMPAASRTCTRCRRRGATELRRRALARLTPARRQQLLWRVAELIDAIAAQFAELECLDGGKLYIVGARARSAACRRDVPLLRRLVHEARRSHCSSVGARASIFTATYVTSRSASSGQIIPWNGALVAAAWKLAPALAAGCSVVLKPAELSTLSVLLLGEKLLEAGMPPGTVNIVPGSGRVLGRLLAEHPDVDKIAFTGSTAVGKQLLGAAQGNLKRLSLELGGKSPTIIFADADLDEAIPRAAAGDLRQRRPGVRGGLARLCAARVYEAVCAGLARIGVVAQARARARRRFAAGPADLRGASAKRSTTSSNAAAPTASRVLTGGAIAAGAGFFYPGDRRRLRARRRAGRAGGDLRSGRHGDAVRRSADRPCATRTTRSTVSPRASGRATCRSRIARRRRSRPASSGSTVTAFRSSACRSAA